MRHVLEMIRLSDYLEREFSVAGTKSTRILIFDVDDTLIKSNATTTVLKNGKVVARLTPEQFNTYTLKRGETFAFDEFDNEEILRNATFTRYWNTLKREYRKGTHICILTARSDPKMLWRFFNDHGIDIKPELIFCTGERGTDLHGTVAQKKQQVIQILYSLGYRTMVFFDDSEENLELARHAANNLKFVLKTVKV